MSIQFRFHPEKAVEAAAIFLKLHGKPMDYFRLQMMLYIADRTALQRMDQPIIGGHYFSMKHSPVIGEIYDLIMERSDYGLPLWSEFISRPSSYEVYFKDNTHRPGKGDLSEEEEEILEDVYREFGNLDPLTEIAPWTQKFPEWQEHNQPVPIEVEAILRGVGRDQEEIEEIRQVADREAYLDSVLHVHN